MHREPFISKYYTFIISPSNNKGRQREKMYYGGWWWACGGSWRGQWWRQALAWWQALVLVRIRILMLISGGWRSSMVGRVFSCRDELVHKEEVTSEFARKVGFASPLAIRIVSRNTHNFADPSSSVVCEDSKRLEEWVHVMCILLAGHCQAVVILKQLLMLQSRYNREQGLELSSDITWVAFVQLLGATYVGYMKLTLLKPSVCLGL
ncbi:hypothetical protein E2542_SST30323 [Spatholobus suberectus]|nr:hypothetical protein E2542_SST30323 [Spatholobus suberectus]